MFKRIWNFIKKSFSGSELAVFWARITGNSTNNNLYSGWVYAAIQVIANAVSRAEPLLYKGEQKVHNHKLLDLLYDANPYNLRQFLYLVATHLELYGQSFWVIVRDKNKILGLIPAAPRGVQLDVRDGKLNGYRINTKFYPPDSILRIWRPRPENPLLAMSTIEALESEIYTDIASTQFLKNVMENGSYVPMVLKVSGSPTPDIVERVGREWETLHAGPQKAGRPAVFPEGIDLKTLDVPWGELMKSVPINVLRDRILAVFGVPASKLGLSEQVTYASAVVNDITFRQEVILPRLALISDAINTQLLPQIDGDNQLWLEFDLKLPEEPELALKKTETLLKTGVLTPNEVRADLGLPPTDWGDVPLEIIRILASQGFYYPPLKEEVDIVKKSIKKAVGKRTYLKMRYPIEMEALEVYKGIISDFVRAISDADTPEGVIKLARDVRELWINTEEHIPDLVKIHAKALKTGAQFAAVQLNRRDIPSLDSYTDWLPVSAMSAYTILLDKLVQYLEQDITRKNIETPEELQEFLADWEIMRHNTTGLRGARLTVTREWVEGQLATYRDAGVKYKTWVTLGDDKVRPTHAAMDGKTIPIGDDFILVSGAKGMGPGLLDDLEEAWNCRCFLAPGG